MNRIEKLTSWVKYQNRADAVFYAMIIARTTIRH
jgi:hypothetical protein